VSTKLPVVSCRLPVARLGTDNCQLTTGNSRSGFTLVEIMVAITVATILFGICTAIFVKVSQYKARSEKLLFMAEEANGALSRIARDLQGLHVADATLNNYWHLEPAAMGTGGDRLTMVSATENAGQADYCTVQYYVANGNLYRLLSGGIPNGAWPVEADSILVQGADNITFSTEPAGTSAGKVPARITVSLQMSDPGGQPAYRRFGVSVRPGSEENQ
jgi:prepilin-type N-terminal cleavage/methylation domain-containing protein